MGVNLNSKVEDKLFPTTSSFIIFISYMSLFIAQGLIVTASQKSDSSYAYNTVTVVLLTEGLKLIASISIYLKSNSSVTLIKEVGKHTKVLKLYMVPALLYCFYNNLSFVNLSAFDPTSYFLLLQLRVVITGVIFQFLFSKKLSSRQWISLLILTAGCVIKQLSTNSKATTTSPVQSTFSINNVLSFHMGLLLIQVFCSCFAGVYNEKLLKDVGAEVPLMVQNVYMYLDSILCNVAVLIFQGDFTSAFSQQSMIQLIQPKVVWIIFNNAAIGIVTSLFLRQLNSILKTFASALELMFTAVLSWMIFGIPINALTGLAIALVTYATWLYAQNPVVNRGRLDEVLEQDDASAKLLKQPSNV